MLERSLISRAVPFSGVGGSGFWSSPPSASVDPANSAQMRACARG